MPFSEQDILLIEGLIVFEGIDGCGKSTVIDAVSARVRDLTGLTAQRADGLCDRPQRLLYKELISDTERFPGPYECLHLAVSDLHRVSDWLGNSRGISRSSPFFLHRYCYSSIADSVALGVPKVTALGSCAAIRRPMTTILLDLDPVISLERNKSPSIAECGGPDFLRNYGCHRDAFIAFQSKVRSAFLDMAESGWMQNVLLIDANREIVETVEAIATYLIEGGFIASS